MQGGSMPAFRCRTGSPAATRYIDEESNRVIQGLETTIEHLSAELQIARAKAEALRRLVNEGIAVSNAPETSAEHGVMKNMLADVLWMVIDAERRTEELQASLHSRIVTVLNRKYDLVEIACVSTIDSRLHEVIEVTHSGSDRTTIEVVTPGHRIGNLVIQRAMVRVVLGLHRNDGEWNLPEMT